jgi:CHASE3 domain sensor protein
VESRVRKALKILTPAGSLRRRVALSLAIVRLILAPVIFLSVYYLIKMDSILDRVVNVDAPARALAQQASLEILEARRAERSYFLLREPGYLQAHDDALAQAKKILGKIRELEPQERASIEKALADINHYEKQFSAAVLALKERGGSPMQRIQQVVRSYENDLNTLLKRARRDQYGQLIQDLRERIGSFDDEIGRTLQVSDPASRLLTADLQVSSQEVLRTLSDLEKQSWDRVEGGHTQARRLVQSAEWVLGIVSGVTILLSIWISFVLPRQVVRPLIDLRRAVDRAASGNYEVEFEVRGDGEVMDLAKSVRNLIAHTQQATVNQSRLAWSTGGKIRPGSP